MVHYLNIYNSYLNLKGFGLPRDCGDQIEIESPHIGIWLLGVVEIVPVVALFVCVRLLLAVLTQKLMELGLYKKHDLRCKALVSDSTIFFIAWPTYIINT